MLKAFGEAWGAKSPDFKEYLSENLNELCSYDMTYKWILKEILEFIYQDENDCSKQNLDLDGITVIDNGDYQGTLLFMIPYDSYQPTSFEYLWTSIGYGSCSACDVLLNIKARDLTNEEERKRALGSLFNLSCHLVSNIKKLRNDCTDEENGFIEMEWYEGEKIKYE